MNPRAPHYKFQSSTSSASNGRDLDSIYGSLRNTFVAASTPTMSSTRETPTPSTSNSTGEPTSHSRSLVKYKPQSSDNDNLLERARSEQQEQHQLQMHTKILRLQDQVNGLMNQRATFEQRQAESDQVIKELRRDVALLKAQGQQHHDKLDVCKRGVDDNAKCSQTLEQRIKAIPGSLEPRFQHHVTRIDKIESLVRGAGTQTKQHAMQLGIAERRIAQLEQNAGDVTATKSYDGSNSQNGHAPEHAGASQLTSSIHKLEETQGKHESYLQTIGESLVAHQSKMDMASSTMDDLRSKLELMDTGNSGLRGNENSAPKGRDTISDTIFKLQSKVDLLAEQIHYQGNDANSPKSDASSTANDVERLMIQMDEVRKSIRRMEKDTEMQRFLDDISLAHKLRLETIFYQLTKEYGGRCAPEEIQYGLDEDRLFILRQRVLERLSVEDGVQCEFERLKESQQMYS